MIVVADQGERGVLCSSQEQLGRSFAALETGEMNEKQLQSSARTIGWDRLETSIALFLRNCHLKRGVHLNDIRKFIVCFTVKELPQIASKNEFNFVYGNHRCFFVVVVVARMVRNADKIRTHSVGKI
jgi:hypothetical protein